MSKRYIAVRSRLSFPHVGLFPINAATSRSCELVVHIACLVEAPHPTAMENMPMLRELKESLQQYGNDPTQTGLNYLLAPSTMETRGWSPSPAEKTYRSWRAQTEWEALLELSRSFFGPLDPLEYEHRLNTFNRSLGKGTSQRETS